MALREDFEHTGHWLFRWRSYLPLVFIGISLLALHGQDYPGHSATFELLLKVSCLLISLIGLSIRILTIGHTPKGTSGRNTKEQVADTLNVTGMYSVVRHPLYLGNFFMWCGVALFPGLWWLTMIYVLAFWLYYERIMFAEEAFLRNKFGDEYMLWSDITPAFIPSFKNYVKSDLPFSAKNVLKREYNGFFSVIVLMFVFELVGECEAGHSMAINYYWTALLSSSCVIWIALRTLKKTTALLNVDGR